MFSSPPARFPRFFQLYFIALYEMLFVDGKEVDSYAKLLKLIKHSGETIKLSEGGGNWSAAEKERGIAQISGILRKSFKKNGQIDPSKRHWISRFENILMNSTTEQTLYDFKMGFYDLKEDAKFNSDLFNKAIKTLTAMANTHRGAVGYVIVGVCDKKASADAHKNHYDTGWIRFGSYFVNGIDKEAENHEKDTDTYFTKLTNLLKGQPISDRDKDFIGRNIFTIKYHNKTVLIISLSSGDEPSMYDGKYYTRFGSNLDEVKTQNMLEFIKRFA
ncbi:RNA-binding domain-containing protein [Azotobacter beijerinckii]|nr:RNA-binding domain-containing protein [Azotobacter beijerinckii]